MQGMPWLRGIPCFHVGRAEGKEKDKEKDKGR